VRFVLFILETRHLVLREMRHSDVESLHVIFSDPLTMRFWPVFERSRTEQWVEVSLRSYAQHGFGLRALPLKGSEEVIGECWFLVQEAEGVAETGIGWHVRRDLWGKGIATEAAWACDYAFDRLDLDRLIALIHPENIASRRLAEKNGMTLMKLIQHRMGTRCHYVIERKRRIPSTEEHAKQPYL
jgi:ribosomal-protein-alanine N-acetyltransferase